MPIPVYQMCVSYVNIKSISARAKSLHEAHPEVEVATARRKLARLVHFFNYYFFFLTCTFVSGIREITATFGRFYFPEHIIYFCTFSEQIYGQFPPFSPILFIPEVFKTQQINTGLVAIITTWRYK